MLESASLGGGLPGWGGLPGPGGICLVQGGLPGPGGSAWSRGVSALSGGVCLVRGCLPGPGGSAWSGGVSAWSGGCLPGPGGCISQHALRQTPSPLWTEFLTHACENITLAQLRCGR